MRKIRNGTASTKWEGEGFVLRPLQQRDVDQLDTWGKNDGCLLRSYDYGDLSSFEKRRWYTHRKENKRRRYLSVFDKKGRMVGSIGIKHRNALTKSGELGFVLDPKAAGDGLGTAVLLRFLEICFDSWKMRRIVLYVNGFNRRAIRVYEEAGFVVTGETLEEFDDQSVDMSCDEFAAEAEYFSLQGGIICNIVYQMELTAYRFAAERRRDEVHCR